MHHNPDRWICTNRAVSQYCFSTLPLHRAIRVPFKQMRHQVDHSAGLCIDRRVSAFCDLRPQPLSNPLVFAHDPELCLGVNVRCDELDGCSMVHLKGNAFSSPGQGAVLGHDESPILDPSVELLRVFNL
jgi:hypothetical protein